MGKVSILGAVYPAVWGLAQLFTGALSDRIGRRPMIVGGMLLQGFAILSIPFTGTFTHWISAAIALGLGTALVYPTLLAAISDVAHPDWRSSAIGVYRLWRDGGYVCGALLAGFMADALSIRWALAAVGILTLCSGSLAGVTLAETLPPRSKAGR